MANDWEELEAESSASDFITTNTCSLATGAGRTMEERVQQSLQPAAVASDSNYSGDKDNVKVELPAGAEVLHVLVILQCFVNGNTAVCDYISALFCGLERNLLRNADTTEAQKDVNDFFLQIQ